jgi:peptide deformylase
MDSRNPWKSRHAFINPEIVETIGDLVEVTEGCLSIPGYFEKTMRYSEIIIKAIDIEHDLEPRLYQLAGVEAQCTQHEMEHFEGKLFIDGYGRVKKDIIKRKMQKYLRENKR